VWADYWQGHCWQEGERPREKHARGTLSIALEMAGKNVHGHGKGAVHRREGMLFGDNSLCGGSVSRRKGIQCNLGTTACVEGLLVGGKGYSAIKRRKPV